MYGKHHIKGRNDAGAVVECPKCEREYLVEVTQEQLDRWQGGELIQHVMPDTTPEERELLVSGVCPTCWERMFGDE